MDHTLVCMINSLVIKSQYLNLTLFYIFIPKIHNTLCTHYLFTLGPLDSNFLLLLYLSSKIFPTFSCLSTFSEKRSSYWGSCFVIWFSSNFSHNSRCFCESSRLHFNGHWKSFLEYLFLKLHFSSSILVLAWNKNFESWMDSTFWGWKYSWSSRLLCSTDSTLEWLSFNLFRYSRAFSSIICLRNFWNWYFERVWMSSNDNPMSRSVRSSSTLIIQSFLHGFLFCASKHL